MSGKSAENQPAVNFTLPLVVYGITIPCMDRSEGNNPLVADETFAALVEVALQRERRLSKAFIALIRAGKIADAYLSGGSDKDDQLWFSLEREATRRGLEDAPLPPLPDE